MTKSVILIVEDIASLSLSYAAQLEEAGFSCIIVDNGEAAIAEMKSGKGNINAVMLDLQLPDMNGLELLDAYPEFAEQYPIIVATADGSIARAIEAMRRGAYDFMVKPLSGARLVSTVKSAVANNVATVEKAAAPAVKPNEKLGGYMGFVGMSYQMQNIYKQIENVSRSRATVFVTGESGTGKEVCAEAVHNAGPRAHKPFIAINCGAIPSELMESELFGHLKGSFTGALSDRIGAVQAASGGTLFLDEICEMELKLQVKLLRFLQSGTVQRVGANRSEDVDVRIICATNRDPETEVAEGRFREDLFYRLAVVPVHLPPLRARGHDIILLANNFLEHFAKEENKKFHKIEGELADAFLRHDWPGNVRELQNLVRRATVMCEGPSIPVETVPQISLGLRDRQSAMPDNVFDIQALPAAPAVDLAAQLRGMTLDDIERVAVENAIETAKGSIPGAAKLLGVSPSTLYRKREKWVDDAKENRA